jgi:hypothetical protein
MDAEIRPAETCRFTPIETTAELPVFSPEGIRYTTEVRIKGVRSVSTFTAIAAVSVNSLEDALTGEPVTATIEVQEQALQILFEKVKA